MALITAFHNNFSVFRMLIVELFLDSKQLESVASSLSLPAHVNRWSKAKRLKWVLEFIEPLVKQLFLSYPAPKDNDMRLSIEANG